MSGAVTHTLLQFKAPDKEVRTCDDIISMHLMHDEDKPRLECDPFHLGGRLFPQLKLKRGERAIILSLKMKYCTNNTGRDVHFEMRDLFQPRAGRSTEHPDVTGVVRLVIPARHAGPVPKASQLVYEPNLVNLGMPIIQYAGMEESILNARSTAILSDEADRAHRNAEFEVFSHSDPLLVFMLRHINAWSNEVMGPQDVVRLKGGTLYKVRRKAAFAARKVFEEAIFPLFCYTHASNQMRLVWNRNLEPPPPLPPHLVQMNDAPPPDSGFAMITFRLKMEYMIVSNNIMGYTCTENILTV